MLNILLPSMGSSSFFKESYFPKPLIEICGKTMLETVMENLGVIEHAQRIYIFHQKDCNQFHLDASVKLLSEHNKVLALKNQTAGALCTSLIAVEYIDNQEELIIVNSDQIIDIDYNDVLMYFRQRGADAGIITFSDIHPRWSYARIEEGQVLEVAEKRPLSNSAIAGFYYYRQGKDFVAAAKQAIEKQNSQNGKYYISLSMNELILMNKLVLSYEIEKKQYHSFYSPEKILEYEKGR